MKNETPTNPYFATPYVVKAKLLMLLDELDPKNIAGSPTPKIERALIIKEMRDIIATL